MASRSSNLLRSKRYAERRRSAIGHRRSANVHRLSAIVDDRRSTRLRTARFGAAGRWPIDEH